MRVRRYIGNSGFIKLFPIPAIATMAFLVVIIRIRTLFQFCFRFIDQDQLTLWGAANDIRKGIFHEPCFYGQAYNPLVEPILAQPFLWLGLPLKYTMPLTSSLLGIFPYAFLLFFFIKRKKYISALAGLVLLLWLPAGFHLLTSIPRGFVPASAIAITGIYFALISTNKYRFFYYAAISCLAIIVSQNASFIVIPVSFYLFLHFYRLRNFYFQSFLGFLAAIPLKIFMYWFYSIHPDYNLHPSYMDMDLNYYWDTLIHCDVYLNLLTPYFHFKLITILGIFILFAVLCFFQKKHKAAASILLGMVFFLFTLAFNKTRDANDNIYFSGVRIFLSIPISFMLFCYWAEDTLFDSIKYKFRNQMIMVFLSLVGLFSFVEQNLNYSKVFYGSIKYTYMIIVENLDDTKKYSDLLLKWSNDYHSGLFIIANWMIDINYYCPAMDYPFTTMLPSYERRTWVMHTEDTLSRKNFIFLPDSEKYMTRYVPINIHYQQISRKPVAYLVETEGRNLYAVLQDMNVNVRYHIQQHKK